MADMTMGQQQFLQNLLTQLPQQQERNYQQMLAQQQPQQPQTGQALVDAAANQAIQQGQQQYQQQQYDKATTQTAQQMINNAGQQVYQRGLLDGATPAQQMSIGQKFLYQDAGERLYNNSVKYMQAQEAGDQAAMDAYSQDSQLTRDALQKLGVDTSAFGADKSLAEKKAALDFFKMQNTANLLDGVDSGTYYDQRYDYYKQRGYSDGGADNRAAKDAKEYQANRLDQLQAEFFTNGFNQQTNAFTNYGVQLVNMMMRENPESVRTIATLLPGPMQDYIANWKERAANNQLARQEALLGFQQPLQLAMLGAQTDAKMQLQDNQAANARENMAYRAQFGGNNSSDGGATTNSLPKLSKQDAKGETWVENFITQMNNIQSDPKTFKDNPYDHRLANAEKEITKALNDGIIDGKMADYCKELLWKTQGVVWGQDNVAKWAQEHSDSKTE